MKCFLPLMGILFAAATLANAPRQSVNSLEEAARAHVESHGVKLGMRQQLEAGPVDTRLLLAKCEKELVTAFAPGPRKPPRMTVEVRCPGAGGWKVYVPVTVHAVDKAVVVTRALETGHLLTAADITLSDSDVSGLPVGYWRDTADVDGLRLTRTVAAGTVLTPSVVKVDPLVQRGEHVTAIAVGGGVSIQANVVALAAGAEGQRIRVKNVSSGKELDAIVRAPGRVEIRVP